MPSVTQEHGVASLTRRDVEQPTADAPASTPFVCDDDETAPYAKHVRTPS